MIEPDAQNHQWQPSKLEQQIGAVLFKRLVRNLELTEAGRMVISHAKALFSISGEEGNSPQPPAETRTMVFEERVADVVPETIATDGWHRCCLCRAILALFNVKTTWAPSRMPKIPTP